MKKTILFAVVAMALLAWPARAADFGLFGAYWDTDDADEAVGIGGKLTFARFLQIRATYFNDVTPDTDPENQDFELRALPLEAGLVFNFAENDRVSPYIGGGAGYYLLDTNFGDVDDEVGWYGVLGVDFTGPSGLGLTVEGIYRNMEATVRGDLDEDPELDEDVDIQLGGIGVNAGLVWKF